MMAEDFPEITFHCGKCDRTYSLWQLHVCGDSQRPTWRSDMESAPKDGTPIDVVVEYEWEGKTQYARATDAHRDDAGNCFMWAGKRGRDRAVAWMEIPPLPHNHRRK